jgi:hypothetical protein
MRLRRSGDEPIKPELDPGSMQPKNAQTSLNGYFLFLQRAISPLIHPLLRSEIDGLRSATLHPFFRFRFTPHRSEQPLA